MNLQTLNPWNWFKHEEAAKQHAATPMMQGTDRHEGGATQLNNLIQLHQQMDKLFDDVFSSFGFPSLGARFADAGMLSDGSNSLLGGYRPNVDVSGDNTHYHISLDVPGLSESDISIDINKDVLTIRGSKEEKAERDDKHVYRMERRYGSFQRTLSLPSDANADDITAQLKDGVLNLVIGKKDVPPEDVKRIPINSVH